MTKTGSFDWSKVNTRLKFSFTKKKFFNQCYYRLNYILPGARLITYYREELGWDAFQQRVDYWNVNSIYARRHSLMRYSKADAGQLLAFAKIYNSDHKPHKVRFRIEADCLSIYSDSEECLYNFATKELANWTSYAVSFSMPENENVQALLDQGFVVVNKPQTHAYKIKLRETFGRNLERKQLGNYLQGLGDDVKVTKYILEHLLREHKYFPAGYIYVNDLRIVDMLRLVSPNLIGSVQHLITQ